MSFNSSRGSSVVDFVLVAPLLIVVFVAATQAEMFLADKSTISSAAIAGARNASMADASSAKGVALAQKILSGKKDLSNSAKISVSREQTSGVDFVRMTVEFEFKIPWIDQVVHISSTSRALDEKSL